MGRGVRVRDLALALKIVKTDEFVVGNANTTERRPVDGLCNSLAWVD
jgi:hypothetical protein